MKRFSCLPLLFVFSFYMSTLVQTSFGQSPPVDETKQKMYDEAILKYTVEPNYAQTEEAAAALGPKNKAYMDQYVRFRNINKELTALKQELPTANQTRQEEIDRAYHTLLAEGTSVYKNMLNVGLEAFEEAPNRNPFVNNYLLSFVEWDYRRDEYENPVRIFKVLAKHGIERHAAPLYVFAGLSAMMTMDLEDAEKWLAIAEETGFLEKLIENYSRDPKNRNQIMTLASLHSQMPELKKEWAKELEIRKSETEAGEKDPAQKLPRVLLKIKNGPKTEDVVVELFENEAPNTVKNFISLVESGFYNGLVFHRVLPMFMAQGGDPTGSGAGGPGYCIDCETSNPNYRKHFRGTLSMAHAGPNTGGSQFFMTFVPTSMLDGKHTAFGRIVEGMDVLADIQRIDPGDENQVVKELSRIVEAKVLNKRDHSYEPKRNSIRR
ncbi:MAG: peptidylprolyl isomerase [Thermoguttaceae bacterium]